MTLRALTAGLLLCPAVLCAQWREAPPEAAPTFTTTTTLVRVDFSAFNGMIPIDTIQREHLRILDNGQPQPIRAISYGEMPLDLVLLFDVSGSMRPAVEKVAATADVAMKELRPGDRVALFAFSGYTRMILPFTSDLDGVVAAIHREIIERGFTGGTRLLAAVDDVGLYLLKVKRNERRRAVIVITDDQGVRTRRESTVANRLWEADASLNGLIVSTGIQNFIKWYGRISAPHVALTMSQGIGGVATKTGGVLIHAGDIGTRFPELLRHLRARPTLFYEMPAGQPGQERKIRLEFTDEGRRAYPNVKLYARTGYRVPVPGEVE